MTQTALLPEWADTGVKLTPDSTKISVGWTIGEKPPAEYMNWWQALFTDTINTMLLTGASQWDATTTYPINAIVSRNGIVYRALVENTNSAPPSGNWLAVTQNATSLTTGTVSKDRLPGTLNQHEIQGTGAVGLDVERTSSATNSVISATTTAGSIYFGMASANLFAVGNTVDLNGAGWKFRVNVSNGNLSWAGVASGAHGGDGSALTNLSAASIATGTLNDARLPATMSGKNFNSGITFTGGVGATTFDMSNGIVLHASGYGFGVTSGQLNINHSSNTAETKFYYGTTLGGTIGQNGFAGGGAGLTNLNAGELVSGTLPNARLSGSYSFANLTLSGTISAADTSFDKMGVNSGTASLPSIYRNGDTDTGIHFPGANVIAVSAGGDARLRVSTGAITAVNGAVFTGDGAGLTNTDAGALSSGTIAVARLPSTNGARDWIQSLLALSPAGSLGSFIYAIRDSGAATVAFGGTAAGSTLTPCSSEGRVSGGSVTGTWRCLGRTEDSGNQGSRVSLWLRIL